MGLLKLTSDTGRQCCTGTRIQKYPPQKNFFPNFFIRFNPSILSIMNITKESEEFPEIKLDNPKIKELENKLQKKEIVCDLKDPENCENCSG